MPAFTTEWPKLLDAQTVDVTGPPVILVFSGVYNLYTSGFGTGGSIAIEWSLDDVTYTPFKGCDDLALAITENGIETFLELNRDLYIRAVLSGAGAGTNITSELRF